MSGNVQTTVDTMQTFAGCMYKPDDIVEIRCIVPRAIQDRLTNEYLLHPGKAKHQEREQARKLAQKKYGPFIMQRWCKARDLPDHAPWCRELNEHETLKYGIYAGANPRTQDGGADHHHVACYRTVFVDIDDTHDLGEVLRRIKDAGLPKPTLIVDSGHGFHVYWWLLEPIADLGRGKEIIDRLVGLLGGDSGVKDPPRVMRLPGFVNTKEPTAQTRIVEANAGLTHNIVDIERCLPQDVTAQHEREAASDDILPTDPGDNEAIVKKCLELLSPKRCQGYDDWLKVGMIVHHAGLTVELWDQWSRASDNYESGICREKWDTFAVANGRAKVSIGSLLYWAAQDSGQSIAEIMDGIGVLKKVKDRWKDFDQLARRFLRETYGRNSKARLITWEGGYYVWEGGRYTPVDDQRLAAYVCQWLSRLNNILRKHYDFSLSTAAAFIHNILHNITAQTIVASSVTLNGWLDGQNHGTVISLANGLLFLDERNVGGLPILRDHDPSYFTTVRLPYKYDPEAQCPLWQAFLDDVMQGNQEMIRLLQQWAGYLFRPGLREQKFLLKVGDGANGKGVHDDVTQELVGRDNCSQVGLARFGNPFALHATLGKVVNVTNESSHIIEEEAESILKSFVAGDRFTFERKFKEPVYAVPTAKIMISTNALPRFTDKTQGIWRRILLVPFEKTIAEENQVKGLAAEIKAKELPGVFNWALEGLRSLDRAGRFTLPERSGELLEEYRRDADPARAFLLENYTYSPNARGVECTMLYGEYRDVCTANGCCPLSDRQFGRQVRRVFPEVDRQRPGSGDSRPWLYRGLVPVTSQTSQQIPI